MGAFEELLTYVDLCFLLQLMGAFDLCFVQIKWRSDFRRCSPACFVGLIVSRVIGESVLGEVNVSVLSAVGG